APDVPQIIRKAVDGEHAHEGIARAANAEPLRIAGLDDEPGHDPVENYAVVESWPHRRHEVVYRVRRHIGIQLHHDLRARIHLDGHHWVLDLTFVVFTA